MINLIDNIDSLEGPLYRNFVRNKTLIDLSQIPEGIKEKVLASYDNQTDKKRDKMFNYFIANRLKNLMEHIGDF